MLIVHNRLIPFKNYDAINILGMLFHRKGTTTMAGPIRHKRVHTRQMTELGFVFFYLFYVVEQFIRLSVNGRVCLSISFEREAHRHVDDPNYLLNRRPCAWVRYPRDPSKSRTRSPKKSN